MPSDVKNNYLAAQTRVLDLQAEALQENNVWTKLKNDYRTYTLHSIDDGEAYAYRTTLNSWLNYDDTKPITVVINSSGGSVFSGFSIYDWTLGAIRDGAVIDTKCIGYAASMGGILLQMGKTRTMTPNSHLMIHEASTFMRGGISASILKDQQVFSERLQERCLKLLAAKSNLTAEEIAAHSDRRDWWLDADEALAAGFIDQVEL
jgi:ATP-dependent Clp protease, protease subunit